MITDDFPASKFQVSSCSNVSPGGIHLFDQNRQLQRVVQVQ